MHCRTQQSPSHSVLLLLVVQKDTEAAYHGIAVASLNAGRVLLLFLLPTSREVATTCRMADVEICRFLATMTCHKFG